MGDWDAAEEAGAFVRKYIAELEQRVKVLEEALRMIESGDCDYPEQVANKALEGGKQDDRN